MQRFIDDTISFVKLGTMNYIITKSNSFYTNIRLIFVKKKTEGTLPFLHVLICRKVTSIVTIVFQKPTNNDIYLNSNAFAPGNWKRRTKKRLVEGTYIVCSTNELLQMELEYLEKVFH